MNEVSIIIDGVRYDAEPHDSKFAVCHHCEMGHVCSDLGTFCDLFGYNMLF